MRPQGEEQIHNTTMAGAAAASGYPDGHLSAGHGQMGLDNDSYGPPMMFGDTSFLNNFDPSHEQVSSHDHHPSQSILGENEVDSINHFFADPDTFNQIQLGYDFSEDKSASNNIYDPTAFDPQSGANGTINLSAPHASLHKTTSHAGNNSNNTQTHHHFDPQSNNMDGHYHPQHHHHQQQQQQHHQQQHQRPQQPQQHSNMSAADYKAANTIHGFRSTPTQHHSQPDTSVGMSSWGQMLMPNPPPMSTTVNMPFQQQNPQSAPGAQRHGSFSGSRNVQYFQGIPQQVPAPTLQRHYSADSSNQQLPDRQSRQWTESQSPSAAFAGHTRPSTVSFGSDPLFEAGHYRNTTPAQQDKSGNLLNIPYSSQAVQAGIRHKSISGASSSHPEGNPQATRPGDGEPARKRRKSHADRDDDVDWTPNAAAPGMNANDSGEEAGPATQSSKRRKSSVTRVQHNNSPKTADEEGPRRGAKKPRETLTEHQKRQHHIQSEKKRREIINQGYSDLNILVPCLNGGKSGLSRSECLQESASYIETLLYATERLMQQMGITEDEVTNATSQMQSSHPGSGAYGT